MSVSGIFSLIPNFAIVFLDSAFCILRSLQFFSKEQIKVSFTYLVAWISNNIFICNRDAACNLVIYYLCYINFFIHSFIHSFIHTISVWQYFGFWICYWSISFCCLVYVSEFFFIRIFSIKLKYFKTDRYVFALLITYDVVVIFYLLGWITTWYRFISSFIHSFIHFSQHCNCTAKFGYRHNVLSVVCQFYVVW